MGLAIAVVGAGPSGIYAVQRLLRSDEVTRVDVLESLPAPYGLLRYGVAADHPKTKTVSRALARAFEDERVRFFGNVHVGRDITRDDLLEHFDAVIYATGARYDRDLGIPGEELPPAVSARLTSSPGIPGIPTSSSPPIGTAPRPSSWSAPATSRSMSPGSRCSRGRCSRAPTCRGRWSRNSIMS